MPTDPTTAAGRYPIRMRLEGYVVAEFAPGTVWRVKELTAHPVPSGVAGEEPSVFTIIDLDPAEAAKPYRDALDEWLTAHDALEGLHTDEEYKVVADAYDKAVRKARELLAAEVASSDAGGRREVGE